MEVCFEKAFYRELWCNRKRINANSWRIKVQLEINQFKIECIYIRCQCLDFSRFCYYLSFLTYSNFTILEYLLAWSSLPCKTCKLHLGHIAVLNWAETWWVHATRLTMYSVTNHIQWHTSTLHFIPVLHPYWCCLIAFQFVQVTDCVGFWKTWRDLVLL